MKEQSQTYCYYSDLPSPMAYMNLEDEEINTDLNLLDTSIIKSTEITGNDQTCLTDAPYRPALDIGIRILKL